MAITGGAGGGPGGVGGPGGGSRSPSVGDLSAQFGILQQINQITLQVAANNREIKEHYNDQLEILEDVRDVLEEISEKHIDKIVKSFQQLSQTLQSVKGMTGSVSTGVKSIDNSFKGAASSQKNFTDGAVTGLQGVSETVGSTTEKFEKMDVATSFLTAKINVLGDSFKKLLDRFRKTSNVSLFFQGLSKGVSSLTALSKGAFSIFKTLLGSVFKLSTAILLFPLNVLKNIIGIAGSATGDTAYAEALQDVVKQFGALGGPTTGAIVDSARSMEGFNKTGLNTYQVFGNMAERLRYVTQMAAETGAAFNVLMRDFEGQEGVLYGYAKGLGLANDEIKLVAGNAAAMGVSTEKYLRDLTKEAYGLAEAFGEQGKVISKDVGRALKDVKHFATATTKQIAQTAVYARKLGLELDRITGIMDAFDTFEDAADNVSRLNQTLGIQVDTFKMMEASTPDEKLSLLRKAMKESGVSAEKLDRFQLRILASSTGLDEQTARTALSLQNQGLSLEEIKKKGSGLDKKTMTQEEAMSKLASSIEKMVKSGESMNGFWDQFKKGISVGVQQSAEFRRMISNIRRSMIGTYYAGVKLGRSIAELFPGLKQVFSSIANMFDPSRFTKFTNDVTKSITKFVKDMSTGSASLPELMKNLKKNFFDWFDKSSPHGMAYLDGLKKFVTGIADIAAQAAKYAIDSLSEGMLSVADLISGKKKIGINAGKPLGFLEEIVMKFVPAFKALGETLWPAIKELSSVLWSKIKDAFMSPQLDGFRKKLMVSVFGVLFGPAMLNLAAGVLAKSISGGAGGKGGILGMILGGGGGGAISKLINVESALPKERPSPGTGSAITSALPDKEGASALGGISGIKISWPDVIKFIVGFASFVAMGLVAFFGALAVLKKSKTSRDEIINAGIAVTAVGAMIAGIAPALDVLTKSQEISKENLKAIGIKLLAIGMFIAAGLGAFYLALKIVSGQKIEDIASAGLILAAMAPVIQTASLAASAASFAGKFAKDPSSLIAGLGAIGAVIAVEIAAAAAIIWMLKDVKDVSGLKAGAPILVAVSEMFMVAAGVAIVAAAIGAMLVSTLGIGLGPLAAGLAAIGDVIGAMVDSSNEIIKHLEQMQGDPEKLKARADAFGSVVHAIAEIANAAAGIVKAIPTGTFSQGSSVIEIVSQTKDLLNGFMSQVNTLVEKLLNDAKNLTEQQINAAGAMGSLFGSVGTMIGALMDPLQKMMEDSTDWFGLGEMDAEELGGKIGGMTQFIDGLKESLIGKDGKLGLIDSIVSALNTLDATKISVIEKVGPVISSVMGAIGSLVNAVKPEDVSKFQKLDKSGIVTIDTVAMNAANDRISGTLTSISSSIPNLLSRILTTVSSLSVSDLKKSEVIGPVLTGISGLIGAIGNSMKTQSGEKSWEGKDVEKSSKSLEKFTLIVTPDFASIFDKLRESLPGFIKSVIGLVEGVKISSDFKSKFEVVTKIFDLMSSVPSMISAFSELSKKGGGQVENVGAESFNLAAHVAVLAEFFNRIAVWDWQYGSYKAKAPLIEIINALNNVGSVITGGAGIVKTIDDVMKVIKGVQDSTSSMISLSSTGSAKDFDSLALAAGISKLAGFWRQIKEDNSFVEMSKSLTAILPSTKDFTTASTGLPDFNPAVQKISSAVDNMTSLSGSTIPKLEKLKEDVGRLKSVMANNYVGDVIGAFNEIVNMANQVDSVLAAGVNVDLPARMNALAAGMGLASRVKSQMKQGDIVININMDVTMDTMQLESAILKQPYSQIRMRLNRALDGDLGTMERTVKNTELLEPKNVSTLTKIPSPVDETSLTSNQPNMVSEPVARVELAYKLPDEKNQIDTVNVATQ